MLFDRVGAARRRSRGQRLDVAAAHLVMDVVDFVPLVIQDEIETEVIGCLTGELACASVALIVEQMAQRGCWQS